MRRGYAIALALSLTLTAGAARAQDPPQQQQTEPPTTRLQQLRERLRGDPAAKPTPPPADPVTAGAGQTGGVTTDPVQAVVEDPPVTDNQLGPDPPSSLIPENGTIGLTATAPGSSRSGRVGLNLGLEAQETGSNPNFFEDPQVLRMLGENPRFIYKANERPDPMVFPPIRNAAIHRELTLAAEKLEADGELRDAALTYQRIVNLEDPRFIAAARQKVSELIAMIDSAEIPFEITQQPVVVLAELPPWVPENMSGIIFNDDDSMVLIGDDLLKIGDSLSNYPDVTVHRIFKDKVVFAMDDRKFEIKVKNK